MMPTQVGSVSDDIWQNEKDQWLQQQPHSQQQQNNDQWSINRMSPPKSLSTHAPENDYMSDVASNQGGGSSMHAMSTSSTGRMYRSVSGQSLGDLQDYQEEQQRQVSKLTVFYRHTQLRSLRAHLSKCTNMYFSF